MSEDRQDEGRAARLHLELDGAFRNRADLYRLMFEEIAGEYGEAEAEAIMTRAIEKRGVEVARAAFGRFGPRDAVALGEAFLAVSPDEGRLYLTDVERAQDAILFKVRRCPLKDAWVAAGVSEERLSTLCRIAGAFDRGLFEATGVRFENITWTPGHGPGCCHIRLSNS